MKVTLAMLALLVAIAPCRGAEEPDDLTGADDQAFQSHLGKVVTISGRLEDGVQGPCLDGAGLKGVVFYVIPEMPKEGFFAYPKTWTELMGRQVRLSGELKFRSFPHPKSYPADKVAPQIPPDYYYMVLQRAKIERVERSASSEQPPSKRAPQKPGA